MVKLIADFERGRYKISLLDRNKDGGLRFLAEVACLLLIVCLSHFKGSKGHVLGITPVSPSDMVRWNCEFDLPSILQESKS